MIGDTPLPIIERAGDIIALKGVPCLSDIAGFQVFHRDRRSLPLVLPDRSSVGIITIHKMRVLGDQLFDCVA